MKRLAFLNLAADGSEDGPETATRAFEAVGKCGSCGYVRHQRLIVVYYAYMVTTQVLAQVSNLPNLPQASAHRFRKPQSRVLRQG